jgi:VWFA-related protein
MSRRLLALAFLACLGGSEWLATTFAQQTPPVFRARTSTVAVTASVKRGNNVVTNLTAADFVVTDNGVPQTVEAVAIESVPIDVTLFLDTSGSTAGKFDEMKDDVQAIIKLLRPGDKFRLLTIGDSVYESVPWVNAGATVDVSFRAVGGISLVQDALMFGLLHRVDPVRRHLVVGMTDRQDCGSVISSTLLLELAGRSEAVMHLVDYSGGGGDTRYRVRTCTPRARPGGVSTIEQAAARTGGALTTQSRFLRASAIVRAFRTIFEDFRQSYVLRYSPTGVDARGWHAISVAVPKVRDAVVRARQGYYGDGDGK